MVDENELKNAKNPFEVGNKVVCPKGDIYMEGKIIENVKSEKEYILGQRNGNTHERKGVAV